MSHWLSAPFRLPYAGGQVAPSCESQRLQERLYHTPIDILDDDSLLNIFYLCQPIYSKNCHTLEMMVNNVLLAGGIWARERWWYKPAHVCKRWRYLILGSPSYLRLSLICGSGTPVADMLVSSPPLPLIIDHLHTDDNITTRDEEGIMLALQHRNRVRRIRLRMPGPILQRLTVAMNEEFPMLEYLYVESLTEYTTQLSLSKTFRAPNLRHLIWVESTFLMVTPLLTTAVNLVTLSIEQSHPLAYRDLDGFLHCLSLLPRLEALRILSYYIPVDDQEAERVLVHTPIMTYATLLNLRWLGFIGATVYLEALLPHITAPHLRLLDITFFPQPTFRIPRLLQFISTTANHRFSGANVVFRKWGVSVVMTPSVTGIYAMAINFLCWHSDRQVESTVQIFNTLKTLLSVVESLTLEHETSLERYDEADRVHWRNFLRPFNNAKTLNVSGDLVRELARSLQLCDGESPKELLPELRELSYSASTYDRESVRSFRSFIDARRNAGYPVTLVHR